MTPFEEQVYGICRRVPEGKVTTYKAIAGALGIKAYQAVGQALHKNPFAPNVPCHRVVNADGSIGGFAGGIKKKMEILRSEGIIIKAGKISKDQMITSFSPSPLHPRG
ncbi:MGMT family protein [Candidatus Woesearchaeota archaeon]|nr:MGMT family protein [Candidatus Woesearchaeota archaeon]HIH38278.1 MGMT family protein [Candidatus Woesearchaeota archaeon]HIH49148.1 MGMT family protein [Candidatus Woesearchaeota archaeon]HIJ04434.1 MGMT family protein [Candidatus Woesearchaeota archaeon]